MMEFRRRIQANPLKERVEAEAAVEEVAKATAATVQSSDQTKVMPLLMELVRETQFPSADKKVSDERSADAAEKDKDVEEEAAAIKRAEKKNAKRIKRQAASKEIAAGKAEEAEDLFDIYLPLVKHEVQPAIGLALRKEVLFKRGAIKSPRQRAPGSSLTATDRAELEVLMARLERRLAAAGHGRKVAAE